MDAVSIHFLCSSFFFDIIYIFSIFAFQILNFFTLVMRILFHNFVYMAACDCQDWLPAPPVIPPELFLYVNLDALQMKGLWESNMNVCFPFMYSQKLNCYFQNRIIISDSLFLGSYTCFQGRSAYSAAGKYVEIYKSLTNTSVWKLGLRPRNSQKRNT